MNEVEFRNLVGRVGRIKYNLYGNVFLLRMDTSHTEKQYADLLKKEVPDQRLSIDLDDNKAYIPTLVDDLVKGDIEMTQCHAEAKEKDFEALRKFALILMNDYASGEDSPITNIFNSYIDEEKKRKILENFPPEKTNDDITLSYDQAVTLRCILLDFRRQYSCGKHV